MADLKVGNVSIKMNLVADVKKTGEGAKVVAHGNEPVRPRVDIKTEVHFDGKSGTSTKAGSAGLPPTSNAPVAVGSGKGVLGHLLATSTAALPDPAKLAAKELKALLEPFFGHPVVVTSFDKDDASTLAQAAKGHSVGDTRGKLVDVNDEGVVLLRDGRQETVKTEFWQLARVRLDDGDRRVIAQDPTYPKHFVD